MAHNADLLYKLESDNLELKKLRDNCLSNYTDSLLADKVRKLVLNTVTLRLVSGKIACLTE